MQTLSELVQARAKDSADRVFCSFNGTNTTYARLLDATREFAGALAEAGVKPGDRVGLMLGQMVEHMELFLAMNWLGAIFVPFSPHLKSAGLELQLNSATPALMVAHREHAGHLREAAKGVARPPKIVWYEDGVNLPGEVSLGDLLRSSRSIAAPAARTAESPVTIMYTSGTTGAPKGAVGSEGSWWISEKTTKFLTDTGRDDIFHFWEPLYHGSGWIVMATAIHIGAKLHMVERFSASRLWDQIAEAKATRLHYLGGVVNIILAQPVVPSERDNPVKIAWGAACPVDSWQQFEDRFGLQVREGYGLTEGGMFTHLNIGGPKGSMGRPIEEYESWVAGDDGQPLGPNQLGELVVRQRGPIFPGMTAYWGEPEKTAQVKHADGTLYTGDLTLADENGYFFFKGRKKEALRRRGENISAWEVERVINTAPGVEESAVVGVDSPLGEQDVMTIVKMREGAKADAQALLKYCAERLAYYQVPRYYQFIDDFPRGPSQRIVKREIKVDPSSAWDAEKAGMMPTRAS